MKKFLMMLMAVASVFVVTGCSDDPEDVVQKWGEAILDGDREAADELVTEDSKRMNKSEIIFASIYKDEFQKRLDKLADGEVVIDDERAEIKVYGKTKIVLVKVDDEWKIDFAGDDDDDDSED